MYDKIVRLKFDHKLYENIVQLKFEATDGLLPVGKNLLIALAATIFYKPAGRLVLEIFIFFVH